MNEYQPFDLQMEADTPYAAIIHFTPNDDICGEGYTGFDAVIAFDNVRLNSWLWRETIHGDKEDVLKSATDLYNEIVRMFKAVPK